MALYRAAMPSATAAEIKQALLADVDPLPAFTGKSVTGGRLSMSRLTRLTAESVSYAFTSMTSPAGTVSPTIGVTGPTTAGDYGVVLGLGMEDAGEIWALAGKAVTLDGVTVTTDDAGDAVFPLGSLPGLDGTGLAPTLELGDGRYVLTVQTTRDGSPVGRTYAAPLLVGSAVPAPSTPGSTIPAGRRPVAPPRAARPRVVRRPVVPLPVGRRRRAPAWRRSSPAGRRRRAFPARAARAPRRPPTPRPPEPAPARHRAPAPAARPRARTRLHRPRARRPPDRAAERRPAPTRRRTPDPGPLDPGSVHAGPVDPDPPAGPVPGTTTYPQVGAFRIMTLSPNVVDTGGGTTVTITGRALPTTPTVRIGGTATGTIVTASTTRVTFRVPARTAGVYDVTVFAPDGRSTVLSNALTYAAEVGSPAPDDGTPDPAAPGDTAPGGTARDRAGGTSPGWDGARRPHPGCHGSGARRRAGRPDGPGGRTPRALGEVRRPALHLVAELLVVLHRDRDLIRP